MQATSRDFFNKNIIIPVLVLELRVKNNNENIGKVRVALK